MAAYSRKTVYFGNKEVIVERGQIATTIRNLTKSFMCAKQTVCDFLSTLEKDGMIKKESTNILTLITITNYDKYQGTGDEENQGEKLLIDQKLGHFKNNKGIKKKNNSKDLSENFGTEKFLNDDTRDLLKAEANDLSKSLSIDEGIRIFKEQTAMLESFCMNNKIAVEDIEDLLSLFKDHCLRIGKTTHSDINKFKVHFRNSLKYLFPKLQKIQNETSKNITIAAKDNLTDYSDTDFGGKKY